MPAPAAVAVAVMGVLSFGVIVGSLAGSGFASFPDNPLLLAASAGHRAPSTVVTTAAGAPSSGRGGGGPAPASPPAATTTTTTSAAPQQRTVTITIPASSTPAPPSSAGSTQSSPNVGLLLISPYVKPGSSDFVDYFNHYSLLATIENLFGLGHLGYAGDPALPVFDASVFNASRK